MNAIILHLLVPKVKEYNIKRVREVERLEKIREVEKIEGVRKLMEIIDKLGGRRK